MHTRTTRRPTSIWSGPASAAPKELTHPTLVVESSFDPDCYKGNVTTESRFRKRVKLVTSLVSYRRADFAVAVAGATVFAFGTVASSWVLRWIIDNVIIERFESGSIDASTTAAGIGIFGGDVITAVDGIPVNTAADLSAIMDQRRPGNTVLLTWLDRGGMVRSAPLVLAKGPVG